jgi:hypothetical protein
MKLVEVFNTISWDQKSQLEYVKDKPSKLWSLINTEDVQPTRVVQSYCVLRTWQCIYYIIDDPCLSLTKEAENSLFSNQDFIETNELYDEIVHKYFKDNSILMNKWLRYAKNMRELG